jgi:hypothetical protein
MIPSMDFPAFDNIEDKTLKQEADQWYSDFIKLLEYSENTDMEKQSVFAVY